MFIASWNSPPKSLSSYGKLTLRSGFYNEKAGFISQCSESKDRDGTTQLSARVAEPGLGEIMNQKEMFMLSLRCSKALRYRSLHPGLFSKQAFHSTCLN